MILSQSVITSISLRFLSIFEKITENVTQIIQTAVVHIFGLLVLQWFLEHSTKVLVVEPFNFDEKNMTFYLEEQHIMDLCTPTHHCGYDATTLDLETRPLNLHRPLPAIGGRNDDDGDHQITHASHTTYQNIQGPMHHLSYHDVTYYRNCMVGGILSSSIRWVLTPLDSIKCNMQVHPNKYPSFVGGLRMVYHTQGIRGLYRGLTPTILSYSTQTGTKYALYEYLKDHLNEWVLGSPMDVAHNNKSSNNVYPFQSLQQSLIYLAAAGTAEAVADILMCPWETLKVQMQTSHRPIRFLPSIMALLQRPITLIEALPPLWSRQILGTMANFMTFEHTSNAIYMHALKVNDHDNDNDCADNTVIKDTHESGIFRTKSDVPVSIQLAVTLCSGFVSGVISTIVSHPADSLLSLKARYPDISTTQLIQQTGWRSLATKGLGSRMALTGSIIGFQWFGYETFKTTVMGVRT